MTSCLGHSIARRHFFAAAAVVLWLTTPAGTMLAGSLGRNVAGALGIARRTAWGSQWRRKLAAQGATRRVGSHAPYSVARAATCASSAVSAHRTGVKHSYGAAVPSVAMRNTRSKGRGWSAAAAAMTGAFAAATTLTGVASADDTRSSAPRASNGDHADEADAGPEFEAGATAENWSGTHAAAPARLYLPATEAELEAVVAAAHAAGRPLRPVGTFLSPNGIAACRPAPELGRQDRAGDMVNLAHMNAVLDVDTVARTVTVEAGIVVEELLAELARHGLTLANFSSIKEQQMGGWTQVAAHGTGAALPTVDEMITELRLVTPGRGTLTLGEGDTGERGRLFRLARVGLGALGVVSRLTLRCVPLHKLRERSWVLLGDAAVRSGHASRLRGYRHLRYMWLPDTDVCVVVASNPAPEGAEVGSDVDAAAATAPLWRLLDELEAESAAAAATSHATPPTRAAPTATATATATHTTPTTPTLGHAASSKPQRPPRGASFADLREAALAANRLSPAHVARVNRAEAAFWAAAAGERVDWSDRVLGFDCGAPQWVLEVAFPCGTRSRPDGTDVEFVVELRRRLAAAGLPAPSPLEQRWTAGSSSPLSPAHSDDPDALFCWVGGIMYLPAGDDAAAVAQRAEVAAQFRAYSRLLLELADEYGGVPHWAKVELPPGWLERGALSPTKVAAEEAGAEAGAGAEDAVGAAQADEDRADVAAARARTARRFDTAEFNAVRGWLDPRGILSNQLIDELFGEATPVTTP